jgi:CPA1 family monovalent cation:H+ antiporter
MHGSEFAILSAILVTGFICQWVAWRVRLPSILFLLLAGILAGPVLGWVDSDRLFGDLLQPIVSLAVAVILYEGSLTLNFSEIRGHGAVVRNLVTIGVLITWISATFAAHWFLGWDPYLATLFGAIVTVSGPTVIIPLLRTIRPTNALANVLRWEGILVDPLGAILAVLVFDVILIAQTAATLSHLFVTITLILFVGAGLGIAAGHAFGIALRKHWVPDYLRDYAALATLILVFAVSEMIAPESGLLAVTIMGIWQANMRDVEIDDILDFKESLTLVLVAGIFILLAARLDLGALAELGAGAVAVLLFLQVVAGPARAFLSSIGSDLPWRERMYLGWILPRGIVAAAVSSLFALRLESIGFAGADLIVPMVFMVIIGTVVLQSLTGRLFASLLGVSNPEPNGTLIIGANPVALTYAEALNEAGIKVMVASTNWQGIRKARMSGLPVFYGSAVSGYAERHLDLVGLGHLLALSDRPDLNELSCVKFRFEFGRDAVYTIKQASEEAGHEKHQVSGQTSGKLLYGGQESLSSLLRLVSSRVETRTTEITDTFTYDDYRNENPDRVALFASHPDGRLRFPTGDGAFEVVAPWKITALAPLPAGTKKGRAPQREHGLSDPDLPD